MSNFECQWIPYEYPKNYWAALCNSEQVMNLKVAGGRNRKQDLSIIWGEEKGKSSPLQSDIMVKILNIHALFLFIVILYLTDELIIQTMCVSGLAIHLLGVKRLFKPLGSIYIPSDGKIIYRLAEMTNSLKDEGNLYWWTFAVISISFWLFKIAGLIFAKGF